MRPCSDSCYRVFCGLGDFFLAKKEDNFFFTTVTYILMVTSWRRDGVVLLDAGCLHHLSLMESSLSKYHCKFGEQIVCSVPPKSLSKGCAWTAGLCMSAAVLVALNKGAKPEPVWKFSRLFHLLLIKF